MQDVLERLEQEVLKLDLVFHVTGTRREDGRTAAQVEAELLQQKDSNGTE